MIITKTALELYISKKFAAKRVSELSDYLYYLRLKDARQECIESTRMLFLWWTLHKYKLSINSVHDDVAELFLDYKPWEK